ncbi:putative bifunctional diguanylate cyclase/phosphodiesterase [Marinobacter caseinilyticus]|uniref:putative bifunctional diguanylate cyclase/phosphodiesterase n=1 Tax=Marinobacter caseinilyticus TaxID=2692195 RepID=UPI0014077201|nr:EAL domain-containing protein [Marinobacter caseinilyticus]
MIELGRLSIENTAAIVGSRNKIRLLAENLEFNAIDATRLATLVSDLCRSLYRNHAYAFVIVAFDEREQGFGLLLNFQGMDSATAPESSALVSERTGGFFDHTNLNRPEDNHQSFLVFKYLPDPHFKPTEPFVEQQRETLARLTRAELLVELQTKNEELRKLLGEIEQRAAKEKKLAAEAAVAEMVRKESRELAKAYKELEIARKHEQLLANYDAVTELPNRVCFQDRLQQSITYAERNGQLLAVLFLDLDHFKNVNDTVGHAEGDQLLRMVAERLLNCVRKSDTVARLGGDEFTLALLDIAGPEAIAPIADNLVQTLSKPYLVGGREFFIGASIGIALYPNDGDSVELLLRNADTAMYKVKQFGRNNYQFYSSDMSAQASAKSDLQNSLRNAIKHAELELYYQPQLDCSSGRIVSMEALLRWRHPVQGFIPPDIFIPLAEETGLILEIGEWVFKEACSQNKAWQEAGYTPMPVAVNLSMRQFEQRNLVDVILKTLAETKLAPQWLELELTEGVFLHDITRATEMLATLRQSGVVTSIDDFGTGYSSLSKLRRLPIDTIKIDRSFTQGVTSDQDDASIVAAIIALAHNLGLKVIAEGVEYDAQLDFLREHRCDQWQGYLCSKALPAKDFETLLLNQLQSDRSK